MNVKGLKINDILDIDLDTFNRMNERELRSVTSRLVSAANKRIRRLKKHNINSPAIQKLGKDGSFSTILPKDVDKKQNVNKLRGIFSNIRSFLTSETSTISGYKKFVKRTKERIAKELNMSYKNVNKKLNVGKLFDLLHKAQERGLVSSYRGSDGSLQARNIIAEILIDKPDVKEEDLMDWLSNQADELYELKEQEEEFEDETDETDLW